MNGRTPVASTTTRPAVPGPTHQSENVRQRGQVAATQLLSGLSSASFAALHPIDRLSASPSNPRRRSIDASGIDDQIIAALQPQPDQPQQDWLDQLETFARNQEQPKFWSDLFMLAGSIRVSGMMQPIIADSNGQIIAGERRWLAARIAGQTTCPVVFRTAANPGLLSREILSFVENEMRSNLQPIEVIFGARQIADAALGGCSMDNDRISIAAFMELTGAGRTTCASYAAFSRLDGDDPLLIEFAKNPPSSLKAAYAAASARIRELESAPDIDGLDTAPLPRHAQSLSVKLPSGQGMKNFLSWVHTSGCLGSLSGQVVGTLVADWDRLADKERRQRLCEAFEHIAQSMEQESPHVQQ